MSAATVYRLHSWNRGGPLCGQVSPNGQCNVRYAVDDHGRDVPADAYDRAALEAWGEYAYLNNARMGAAA
jgi:hypothetical protein